MVRADLITHGSDDQLEQYVLGRLPAAEIPQIEEHLLTCIGCQERADEFEAVGLGFRQALNGDWADANIHVSQGSRERRGFMDLLLTLTRRPVLGMALAFALLIAVVGLFSRSGTKFAPVAALQLTAIRGEMPSALPARQFELTLTDGPKDRGVLHVAVVDAVGAPVWHGLAESGSAGVRVEVKQKLALGVYFVRIYEDSGALLKEYGFHVREIKPE
jgi:anti-sigma factor RsiW